MEFFIDRESRAAIMRAREKSFPDSIHVNNIHLQATTLYTMIMNVLAFSVGPPSTVVSLMLATKCRLTYAYEYKRAHDSFHINT